MSCSLLNPGISVKDPKRWYLACFFIEALFWNDWADVQNVSYDLGETYLSTETRPLETPFLTGDHSCPIPPIPGGLLNFRLLNRHQRVQAWCQAFLGLCHPEYEPIIAAVFESSIYASFLIVLEHIILEIEVYLTELASLSSSSELDAFYFQDRQFALSFFLALNPSYFDEFDFSELIIPLYEFRRLLKKIEGRTEETEYLFHPSITKYSDQVSSLLSDWDSRGLLTKRQRSTLLMKYPRFPYTAEETDSFKWYFMLNFLSDVYLDEPDFNLYEGTALDRDPALGADFSARVDQNFKTFKDMQINYDYFCVSGHLSLCSSYEESFVMLLFALTDVLFSGGQVIPSKADLIQKAEVVPVKKDSTVVSLLKQILSVDQLQYLEDNWFVFPDSFVES